MNVDAAQLAANFASYDIQPFQFRYNQKLSTITSQTSAINQVKSALDKLEDAAYNFTKVGASVTQTSTTTSSDEFLSVVSGDGVDNFELDVFVKQLAGQHQLSLSTTATASTDVMATSGTFTVNGNTTINIEDADQDASGDVTYSEFVTYFNGQFEDSMQAVLVKSQGAMQVLFSSKQEGAIGQFTLQASADSGLETQVQTASDNPVQVGQDAIIALGGKDGVELTNSSNTFEDLVNGVDVTLKKVNQDTDIATRVSVADDMAATMDAMQNFVDAYNKAVTDINSLTRSGSEEEARGALASDSIIRTLKSQLANVIRGDYNGTHLYELGLEIDRDGKLSLDRSQFEEGSKTIDIEKVFVGDQGVFPNLESRLDVYLDLTDGTLSRRLDILDGEKSRVNDALDSLDIRYQTYYNRYLAQFTQLNALDAELATVSGLFTV